MTAQAPESIVYLGRKLRMCTEPLEVYFSLLGIERPVFSRAMSTALWRGYIGEWKLEDDRLYLLRIRDGSGNSVPFSAAHIQAIPPVFASWFSGELRIVDGEITDYVHAGYGSKYERETFLTVHEGVVIATRDIENAPDASPADAGRRAKSQTVTRKSLMLDRDKNEKAATALFWIALIVVFSVWILPDLFRESRPKPAGLEWPERLPGPVRIE